MDSLKSKFVGEAFLINGRGYSLLAEYPLSLAAVMPSTSERFFESLRPLR